MAQTTNTPAPRPKNGFKVARAGYDALTATDYQLLFNSGWPSIAIGFTKSVTDYTGATAVIPHPLGFPPFTMAWVITSDGLLIGRVFPSVDKDNLYLEDPTYTPGNKYYIQAYSLDISTQAIYPFIAPPAASQGPYNKDYGAKFAKPGMSSNSHDLNDFIFHTRAMSPAILAVNVTPDPPASSGSLGETISFANPNNYTAWVFGYGLFDGVYIIAPPYSQAAPRLFIDIRGPGTFTLATGGGGGSLIALRDPLFASNTVEVQY